MMYTIKLDGAQGGNTTYRHNLKNKKTVSTSLTKSPQITYRHLRTDVKDNKPRTFYFYFFTTRIKSLRLLSSLHMVLTLKTLLVSSSNFLSLLLYTSIETLISIVYCSEKKQLQFVGQTEKQRFIAFRFLSAYSYLFPQSDTAFKGTFVCLFWWRSRRGGEEKARD